MSDARHSFAPVADPGHRLDVDVPSRTPQLPDLYLLRRLLMNGPDHFREAEGYLQRAVETPMGDPQERYYLAAAQVHATLALAAATALTGAMAAESYTDEPELKAWHDAAGVKAEDAAEPDQPEPAAPPACWCADPGRTEAEMYQCPAGESGDCLAHDYLAAGGALHAGAPGYPQPDLSDLRKAQEALAVPPMSDADKARANLAEESLATLRSKLAGPVVTP